MTPHDLALLYLSKGRDDEVIAAKLAPMEDVADSGVGFHAQQAVEKYLKAVLALNEVRVRKTHEIAALITQVRELGIEFPRELEAVVQLGPYSVLERYPLGGVVEPLDRRASLQLIAMVRRWAEQLTLE